MSTNNFDEYQEKLKKVKLDPSRVNLKPSPDLPIEKLIPILIKEGEALLAAEPPKAAAPKSVKSTPKSKQALDDALGKMSDNPYIRARTQILSKMAAEKRSVIEKMEKGTLPKDSRYDEFCKDIRILGDKLSSNN